MKTEWHTAECIIEYAQVFEANRDMGTGGRNPNVDKAREKTDGLYKATFYPVDEKALKIMESALSDPMFNDAPRWKEGPWGIGKGTSISRKHKDPSGFEDFSGPPEVVYKNDDNKWVDWDYENDGPLWNGSHVLLKFTTYGEGPSQTVRMVKIGVLELAEAPEMDEDERF